MDDFEQCPHFFVGVGFSRRAGFSANLLTCYVKHDIMFRVKGGEAVAQESRAEYFRNRRERFKIFSVEVEREKMERFEASLRRQKRSKAEWLNEKIDEELSR